MIPMADEGSGFRAVLIIVIAVLLVVSAFSFFRVAYPTGPAPGSPSGSVFRLFLNQFNDTNGLGVNDTKFTPASQNIVLVQGYVYNNTSTLAIVLSKLYVAVYPYETQVGTSSSGLYHYYIRYMGKGYFAYKVPGYYSSAVYIDASTGVVWANVTLEPMPRYNVSGTVQDVYGNMVAGITIEATNFYETMVTFSNGTGSYSFHLYNDTYSIQFSGSNYATETLPLNVSGHAVGGFNPRLLPSVASPFTLSGHVVNSAGMTVPNATLHTYPVVNGTRANSSGFFSIKNMYGSVTVTVTSAGYLNKSGKTQPLSGDLTNLNITLVPVASIGQGLRVYNLTASSQTGDPSVNATELIALVNSSGSIGPVSTGNVHLTLKLSSPAGAISGADCITYLYSDGVIYRGLFTTNSTGYGYLSLNFTGSYCIVILTLYYGYYVMRGNYSGPSSIFATLQKSPVYNLSLMARNTVDNFTVPSAGFAVSNSLFNIKFTTQAYGNYTYFNATLPIGLYLFSYNNSGYLNASASVGVQAGNSSAVMLLYPYLVRLINRANLSLNVNLYSSSVFYNTTLQANTSLDIHSHMGSYSLSSSFLNNSYSEATVFNITASSPVASIYFNRTYSSMDATPLGGYYNATTGTYSANFSFSPRVAGTLLIDGFELLSLNFTPVNSTVTGSQFFFNFTGNATYFAVPFIVQNVTMKVAFASTGLNSTEGDDMSANVVAKFDYSAVTVSVSGGGYPL